MGHRLCPRAASRWGDLEDVSCGGEDLRTACGKGEEAVKLRLWGRSSQEGSLSTDTLQRGREASVCSGTARGWVLEGQEVSLEGAGGGAHL